MGFTLRWFYLSFGCLFQVGNRDTLTSVAARFDTTPSELTSINKLNSSFIYPGQQLLVPDKSAASGENTEDNDSNSSIKDSPAVDKVRKLSAEESQQEEKEKGELEISFLKKKENGVGARIHLQMDFNSYYYRRTV